MNNAKSIEIAEKLNLNPGDHLIAQRILYTHHGLYIDEGYVADYVAMIKQNIRRMKQ